MKLYEVKVPLEAGYTMSILMASPDEVVAKNEVAKQLREVSGPRGNGDCIKYNFRIADMTAAEVVVEEIVVP